MGSNGAGDSAVMTMAHRLRPPAEPYRSAIAQLMTLQFHQQAFDRLGIEPKKDSASVAIISLREKELGIELPPSVREFYSLRDAKRILAGASDIVTPLEKLGYDYTNDFPFFQIFHDWNGPPSLYIHIDGKPDPDVRIAPDGNESDLDENGFPREIVGPFSQVVREQIEYLLQAEADVLTHYEKSKKLKARSLFTRVGYAIHRLIASYKRRTKR